MEQRRLGRTGLMVSALGFGGIPIQRLTDDEAVAVVRHCLDLGVTFIDTAHGYTTSERHIGMAIQGRRDKLVLATKSHSADGPNFRADMEQSFASLQTDYIDLYQFHNISRPDQLAKVLGPGGAMEVALEAKAAGRIGHIGVTSHSLDMAAELIPSGHFETIMFPFNFITREPVERLLPLCAKHDVGFISMKPMGGGLLESAELAFKWLKQHPLALPLVGIQSVAEIDEIVAVMEDPAPLSAAQAARIKALSAELGTRFCRSCDYCQPCPQGIQISSVLRSRSNVKRFHPDRFWGASTEKMVAIAETCLECGECETRCPFELPIREMLKENTAWYREQQALRTG